MCATKVNKLNTNTINRKQQKLTTINYIKTWGIVSIHIQINILNFQVNNDILISNYVSQTLEKPIILFSFGLFI